MPKDSTTEGMTTEERPGLDTLKRHRSVNRGQKCQKTVRLKV